MPRLLVKKFSCIESAELELGPLTVIIGPQASGKSVLSKLTYFFTQFFLNSTALAEEGLSLELAKKKLQVDFMDWFPVTAWGAGRFKIEFAMGPFKVRMLRKLHQGELDSDTAVSFSIEFDNYYRELTALSKRVKIKPRLSEHRSSKDEFDVRSRFSTVASHALHRELGDEFLDSQIFIPAGRSLFTSIGKMMLVMEHVRSVDAITAEFGRRYATARERVARQRQRLPRKTKLPGTPEELLEEILGGRMVLEQGKESLKANDGRLIPFSALSSGQQELLPLAMILLESLSLSKLLLSPRSWSSRRTMYIEEPEAHLFPRAQSALVEILCSLIRSEGDYAQSLLVTTHSPYVLVKLNNLIKAGALAEIGDGNLEKELGKIFRLRNWLEPATVKAYAIVNGKLESILDDEGMIAADYLDDVSGEISREFYQLLALEKAYAL
jgi:hypothetical protein